MTGSVWDPTELKADVPWQRMPIKHPEQVLRITGKLGTGEHVFADVPAELFELAALRGLQFDHPRAGRVHVAAPEVRVRGAVRPVEPRTPADPYPTINAKIDAVQARIDDITELHDQHYRLGSLNGRLLACWICGALPGEQHRSGRRDLG